MSNNLKIGVIGGGNMAEAIVKGLLKSENNRPASIIVSDVSASRRDYLAQTLHVTVTDDNTQIILNSDVIVLAVKPNVVEEVIGNIRETITDKQTLISIAAGVKTKSIEKWLNHPIPVIRVMPNTPALVGAGISALAAGKYACDENMNIARGILSSIGKVVDTDEKLLDAVTGLSGSGPAYVFEFIDALAAGGVKEGLRKDVALLLAAQTVLGSALLVLESGDHPSILRDKVTSPGGTTIAGLYALESGSFKATVMDAVSCATERSRELSEK